MGYQVNHLARLLEQALRTELAPHGVTPGVFPQLLALYERDGLSQSELSNLVQVDQSTTALTVRRMERDGLVTRTPSEHDRRRTEIRLTQHARDLEPVLIQHAIATNARATTGVTPADLEIVDRVVTMMIANLQGTSTEEPS